MKFMISLFVVLAAVSMQADAKKMYKWTDEKGVVHFSDTQPPEQAKLGHQVINKSGIAVETQVNQKDALRVAEEKKQQELALKKAEEQERADRVLLAKYATEDDISRGYQQNVELLDEQIRSTQADIESRQKGLAKLVTQAGELERASKVVPEQIKIMITQERKQIEGQKVFIQQRQKAKVTSKQAYDKDLARYREVYARVNSKAK